MKEEKSISTIIEYATNLYKDNLCGKGDMISICHGDLMYYTQENCDFGAITAADVLQTKLTSAIGACKRHADIYSARPDIEAICHCHPAWVAPVAEVGKPVPAVLDDLAQIVGPNCKTSQDDTAAIIKTLKGRNSCLVKGNGCLTSGRTMSEAYTCVLVLDKACHCFVSSCVIGKNKVINGLEARLMRFVYKKKYSKTNQKNISQLEGEN